MQKRYMLFLFLVFTLFSVNSMEIKIRKVTESISDPLGIEIYIIDVYGEMDLYNSYKLKDLVIRMVESNIRNYIINLQETTYIDNSGMGALIYICSTLGKKDLKLYISNIHGSVKEVIELTKLTGYFPIAASIDDAIDIILDGEEIDQIDFFKKSYIITAKQIEYLQEGEW